MKFTIFGFLFIATLAIHAQCIRQDDLIAIDEPAMYPVEGTAVMQFETDGTKQVVFQDDFETVQGIELRVFLSTTERLAQGGTEVEISTEPLQDDNGGQDLGDPITGLKTFDVPADVELADFDYVIIQCVQADVLWGRAVLGALEGPDCSTLTLEDTIFNTTRIFPNPTQNVLHISSQNNNIQVALFDSLGRKILQQAGTQTIDLSSYKTGIYFVQLTDGKKQRTIKVIRE